MRVKLQPARHPLLGAWFERARRRARYGFSFLVFCLSSCPALFSLISHYWFIIPPLLSLARRAPSCRLHPPRWFFLFSLQTGRILHIHFPIQMFHIFLKCFACRVYFLFGGGTSDEPNDLKPVSAVPAPFQSCDNVRCNQRPTVAIWDTKWKEVVYTCDGYKLSRVSRGDLNAPRGQPAKMRYGNNAHITYRMSESPKRRLSRHNPLFMVVSHLFYYAHLLILIVDGCLYYIYIVFL